MYVQQSLNQLGFNAGTVDGLMGPRTKTALEEFQTADFYGILKAMEGLPVVIRLLDAPLHEFLPGSDAEIGEVAEAMGVTRSLLTITHTDTLAMAQVILLGARS